MYSASVSNGFLASANHSPTSPHTCGFESPLEFESFHFCSMASNLARGVDRDLG